MEHTVLILQLVSSGKVHQQISYVDSPDFVSDALAGYAWIAREEWDTREEADDRRVELLPAGDPGVDYEPSDGDVVRLFFFVEVDGCVLPYKQHSICVECGRDTMHTAQKNAFIRRWVSYTLEVLR